MQIPEFKQIQDLLTSFLGQPKNDFNEVGQLQYNCPRCIEEKGDKEIGKFNLEINIFKGVYMCWSCCSVDETMKGPIRRLIKKYGNSEILSRYESIINDIRNNALYRLPQYEGMFQLLEEKILTLPSTFTNIPNINKCKKNVKEYLEKRGITQEIIDKYNIGYTTWDEPEYKYKNRIIIPSYDSDGNLNYWVGRDYTDKAPNKYCNCEGIQKTGIVFQESNIQFDADITLVEGALDCVYGNNTIALLGKQLDNDNAVVNILKEKANANIIICLDGDTTIKETKKIYDVLNKGRLKNKIKYINMSRSGFKDFGEAYVAKGKQGIIELLRSQETFENNQITYII